MRPSKPNKLKHHNLGQRKVYFRAKQGEWVAHTQKAWSLQWVSRKSFYRQNWGEVCRVCDFFLVGGEVTVWYSRNLKSTALWFQRVWCPHTCVQSEVSILCLGEGLGSYRRTQSLCIRLVYVSTEEEPEPYPIPALLFLDCLSFVSVSPHLISLNLHCESAFESALWNSRKI